MADKTDITIKDIDKDIEKQKEYDANLERAKLDIEINKFEITIDRFSYISINPEAEKKIRL